MANEKEISIKFKIEGVDAEVKNVEEFADAMNKVADATEKVKKETKENTEAQGNLSKRISGIKETFAGLKGDFKLAAKGIKTFFTSGTTGANALKIALAATGIPLLIGAVIALVGYFKQFDIVARTITKVTSALGAVMASLGSIIKKILTFDFAGAWDETTAAINGATTAVDAQYDAEAALYELRKKNIAANAQLKQDIEAYKKVLEDTTKAEGERLAALNKITAATKQLNSNRTTEIDLELTRTRALRAQATDLESRRQLDLEIADLQAQRIDQATELQNIEYDAAKVGREIRQAARDQAIQNAKDINDKLTELRVSNILDEEAAALESLRIARERDEQEFKDKKASKEQLAELQQQYEDKETAIKLKGEEDRKKAIDENQKQIDAILKGYLLIRGADERDAAFLALEQQKVDALASLDALKDNTEAKAAIEAEYLLKVGDLTKQYGDQDQKDKEARVQSDYELVMGSLSAIAGLMKENSKAQKKVQAGLAIADALAGSIKAFNSQLIPGDPTSMVRGALAAGTILANGYMTAKKILTADSGSAKPTVPKSNVANPAATTPGGATRGTGVGQGVGSDMTNQQSVIKAYVVAEDVSSQQEANKKINNLSRL